MVHSNKVAEWRDPVLQVSSDASNASHNQLDIELDNQTPRLSSQGWCWAASLYTGIAKWKGPGHISCEESTSLPYYHDNAHSAVQLFPCLFFKVAYSLAYDFVLLEYLFSLFLSCSLYLSEAYLGHSGGTGYTKGDGYMELPAQGLMGSGG